MPIKEMNGSEVWPFIYLPAFEVLCMIAMILQFLGIICLILYLLGFTMVQNSGNYWLQLIDDYCSGIPLLVIALVECLSLSYIYGMPRYPEIYIIYLHHSLSIISYSKVLS